MSSHCQLSARIDHCDLSRLRVKAGFMKHLLARILIATLLGPPAFAQLANHASLESFATSVEGALDADGFSVEEFCTAFWNSSDLWTCVRSIPWPYVRQSRPKLNRTVIVHPETSGFISLALTGGGTLLLTATKAADGWKASFDDPGVWQDFTAPWMRPDFDFEARFAKPIGNELQSKIYRHVQNYNDELAQIFANGSKKRIPFYFLNSPTVAVALSMTFPPYFSGGARKDFVVMVGDPANGMWSTLLHELVHSYTAFPGTLWKGDGPFPSAAFSEGLATVFQMNKIWDDEVPANQVAASLCRDLQIAESLAHDDFLQLLNDPVFRTFDQRGYHPAYLAAAAIIGPLQASLSRADFAKLWNQLGRAGSAEAQKRVLLELRSEEKLRSDFSGYLTSLRAELSKHASLDCPNTVK